MRIVQGTMPATKRVTGRRRVDPWVGPWLRARREDRQIERATIADRLGRDLSNVSRLETGDSAIPADDLPIVLRAYEATPDDSAAAAKSHRKSSRPAA